MVITRLSRLLVFFSLLWASNCWGAQIHGRSSTQLFAFENQMLNDKKQVELAEYLRFSITDIDPDGKLTIHGYGRGSQDFSAGEGLNGRLYYLYGEYRDLFNKVDLRAGRQFVNLAAASAVIDGAQLDLKNIGPVAFTALGGRDVIYGINGEAGGPTAVVGLGAYLAGFSKTDAEFSWFRKWDDGDVARDILGATAKHYLFNSVRLYGNTRFDLTSETFNELLVGLKYYPTSDLIFTAEYFHSYPTFDVTSIYSVFAVNGYDEGVFRVDYTLNDKLTINAGYNRQWYGEGAAADVYHIGAAIRPVEALRVSLEYDKRQGYYGNLDGGIAEIAFVLKGAEIAGGIHYDVYERDALTGDETARRYWLGAKYRLARNITVSGRIQDDVNARYSTNITSRLTLDYDF